eukprot:UN27355
MSGQKIEQARGAAVEVVKALHAKDYFNILCFDGDMYFWRDNLVVASPVHVAEAVGWMVSNVAAKGSTDINESVLNGLQQLKNMEDDTKLSMILFLTDGSPTAGVTNLYDIRKNVLESNQEYRYSINSLGFGEGADMDFYEL